MIDLYADPAQIIGLTVAVRSIVPAGLEPALLGIVHELTGNAVKHGFHMRLIGEVAIRLENDPDGRLVLMVGNDGWPIEGNEAEGQGLALVRELAAEVGGRVRTSSGPPTVIEVRLPVGDRA
ncbi:MAG: ATP-binding protein [Acetobacteraceae bacterium]